MFPAVWIARVAIAPSQRFSFCFFFFWGVWVLGMVFLSRGRVEG